MRNLEELNKKHIGRMCFILGSGCSLLNQDLSLLSDHISIAVNSGFLAYPSSNYFLSDDWSVREWSYFFKDLVNSNTEVLLYEDKLKEQTSLFGDRSILFRHRKGYNLTHEYDHGDYKKRIWESRTSVGSAIHVAHIMGCQTVVLLGIDGTRINGYRYFWQHPDFKNKPYRQDGLPLDDYKKIGNTDTDLADITKYWNRIWNSLRGQIILYNASEVSVITGIPKKRISEF